MQYSYDKFDRTTKEQYNNVTYEYAYDASGQLAKQTSTAGEEYNYCYNEDGGYRASLPDYVNYRDSSSNLIYGDNCHYDSNGRLVKILDSGSSTTTRAIYGYDQQGQLTSATVGGTRYTYTYDMAGVRSSKTVGSTTYKYTTLSGLVTRQTGGNAITHRKKITDRERGRL